MFLKGIRIWSFENIGRIIVTVDSAWPQLQQQHRISSKSKIHRSFYLFILLSYHSSGTMWNPSCFAIHFYELKWNTFRSWNAMRWNQMIHCWAQGNKIIRNETLIIKSNWTLLRLLCKAIWTGCSFFHQCHLYVSETMNPASTWAGQFATEQPTTCYSYILIIYFKLQTRNS